MKDTGKATRLKHMLMGLLMGVLLAGLAGCIGDSEEDEVYDLSFKNMSSHRVSVVSLTTEWGSFSLAPGETVKLRNIRNVDYYFEPKTRVQEGSDSSEREVVFVNAPPST